MVEDMCFIPNPAPRLLAYINFHLAYIKFHQIGLFVSLDVADFKHRIQIGSQQNQPIRITY